ncbi:hypothetical protein ACVNHC_07215 [Pannonibacter sp. Q-1]
MASMPQLSGTSRAERMANILGLQHMTLHGVDAMIKSWHDESGCVVTHFPLRERGGDAKEQARIPNPAQPKAIHPHRRLPTHRHAMT